ncbi:MAG TPA: hypothetical protein VFU73_15770 [Actinocrinis sp.]|nr:hypothetical protein [Actinocrinis sp.]
MAGYSGTPLARKLGIKDGAAVALLDAPDAFETLLAPLPPAVTIQRDPAVPINTGTYDIVVGFTTRRETLARWIGEIRPALKPAGGLWIAWPKRASKIATEVTEDTVRELALPTGLVDNKVCAIDETWSALRLVVRRELRRPA